jgi:hypothetical protein
MGDSVRSKAKTTQNEGPRWMAGDCHGRSQLSGHFLSRPRAQMESSHQELTHCLCERTQPTAQPDADGGAG